jgi:hypothetical protein
LKSKIFTARIEEIMVRSRLSFKLPQYVPEGQDLLG